MDSTILPALNLDLPRPQVTADQMLASCKDAGRYLIATARIVTDEHGHRRLIFERMTNDFPTIDLPKFFSWLQNDLSEELSRSFVPGDAPPAIAQE